MAYEIKYRSDNEMKDSGIEWLGKIPKEWEVRKYKDFAISGMGNTILKEELDDEGFPVYSATEDDSIFGYLKEINLTLNKGDIVIPARGNSIGHVYLVKEKIATCTQTTIYSKIKNINNKFLVYCAKGLKEYWFVFDNTAIPQITVSQVQNNLVPVPPCNDQQKIANFLDIKTSEFDTIISKKELLIEKLEEAKKSLISEVVTGKVKIVDGELVDRKPEEMKDSGVEWLGMIPKDWEIKRIKHISQCYPSNVDKKSYVGEKKVKLCNYTDVYYNDYITKDLGFMIATASQHEIRRFGLIQGDIILTKDSESPDDIGIASYINETIEDLVCGYHLTIIRCKKEYISKYIYFQLLSTGIKNYFATIANGITRYGIGIAGFNNLTVCIPQIKEQKEIVYLLEQKIYNINSIITKTQKQITKLKEAKQSLISEAVTGKIDLRDWEIIETGGR